MITKIAYEAGQAEALAELGLEGAPMGALEGMPEEMPMGNPEGLSADAFAEFAEQDNTEELANPNQEGLPMADEGEKKPHWGGNASLDAGDAGTRGMEMGLPTSGAA